MLNTAALIVDIKHLGENNMGEPGKNDTEHAKNCNCFTCNPSIIVGKIIELNGRKYKLIEE